MEQTDYGPCCACGLDSLLVRNFITLDCLAPVPGTGWGCFVCGLPQDGAMAIVCDACKEIGAPLRHVICGYPEDKQRSFKSDLLEEPFGHNEFKHLVDDSGQTA